MATASRFLRRFFALALAALTMLLVVEPMLRNDDNSAGLVSPTVRVAATSSYQFDSLLEMGAASDAVVRATVVATERGRVVGDPDVGGIVSRIVTLEVDETFGTAVDHIPSGTTVLIEEEGWLTTGETLIVDDLQPSSIGDSGVWFLDALEGTDATTFLVINSQGRYLDDDGRIDGGRVDDPLVDAVEAVGYDELVDILRDLTVARPGPQEPTP